MKHLIVATTKGEDFLIKKEVEKGIFSCNSSMKFLSEQNAVLMDGTFDCALKYFMQLFTKDTANGYCKGTYIPLVLCLLRDNKKRSSYDVLQLIKGHCENRKVSFETRAVIVDFDP